MYKYDEVLRLPELLLTKYEQHFSESMNAPTYQKKLDELRVSGAFSLTLVGTP